MKTGSVPIFIRLRRGLTNNKRVRPRFFFTVEAFVRARLPGSARVELCHDGRQVVVHRGWTPIAEGCKPEEGDRVVPLD